MSDVFTNVKLFPLKTPAGNLLANGSVLVSGTVEVKFTIMKGSKGLFASLPARKGNKPDENGRVPWYPEVKIPSEELYQEFQTVVKSEYTKLVGGDNGNTGEHNQDPGYTDDIPW
jgi:DNA-binding cell septation regulator SpoVG